MKPRKGPPARLPGDAGEMPLEPDLLSAEAREHLQAWRPADQQLFAELLQDAPSELQRELLQRALAAAHGPAKLHAFADEIRPLSDGEVFEACTLAADHGSGRPALARSVVERLRAEADPLYAFELNGHLLTPRPEDTAGPAYELTTGPRSARRPPAALMVPLPTPEVTPRPRAFDVESTVVRGRRDVHDLGVSAGVPAASARAGGPPPSADDEGRIAEGLMNEAVRTLGVSFREQAVDGAGLKLEKAIDSAQLALMRGVPVPVILGPRVGEHRRYALILQVQTAGKRRAFQFHDPFSHETLWVNEGDLFARTELPFSNKSHRRITAIALPNPERKLA